MMLVIDVELQENVNLHASRRHVQWNGMDNGALPVRVKVQHAETFRSVQHFSERADTFMSPEEATKILL